MNRYIDTAEELNTLLLDLKGSDFVAIDTEFMREKTYYPKLCLVQINNDNIQAIIDAVAISDLSAFASLLQDKSCMKIFHAATQDIEVLYYAAGVTPWPLFDTQLAAALLGYPLQVGYGPLVQSVCGVKLPKADGYSNWARRPLSHSQIKYALDDVVFLPEIYKALSAQLAEKGRLSWLDQDFRSLAEVSHYKNEPREMWRHVKRASALSSQQLAIVRELAAWREVEAMHRDFPRKRILSDEAIVEIARKAPKNKEELFYVRGLEGTLNKRNVNKVLACIETALRLPPELYPQLPKKPQGEAKLDGVVNLMAALVELRAHQNKVAVPALASRDELTRLAHGHTHNVSVLTGWRYEMIGKELLELLDGKLSLHIDDNMIAVEPCA